MEEGLAANLVVARIRTWADTDGGGRHAAVNDKLAVCPLVNGDPGSTDGSIHRPSPRWEILGDAAFLA